MGNDLDMWEMAEICDKLLSCLRNSINEIEMAEICHKLRSCLRIGSEMWETP